MKFTITVSDCTAEEAKQAIAALTGGKASSVTAEAPAKGKGKKAPPPAEEEIEEEQEEFGAEEEVEDEPDFDADAEEEIGEEEEEEVAPAKKSGKTKTADSKPAPTAKVSIEDVIKQFQATKKVLAKKLKSEEKANAKLNALLKKHGSKSIKGLKPALLGTVLKEVKALAV